MKTENIIFTASKKAELCEGEISAPKPNEVQVRNYMSAISSGTERANLIGLTKDNVYPEKPEDAVFPRHVGYSCAGIVEAVGEDVKNLKVGDRVALYWSHYATLQNIEAEKAVKLPDNVSFSDAALFHISIFPLAAIRKCKLEIGESAIVMGMGILGLLAVPLLKAAGATPIIAVDPSVEKREKALKSGADYALDPYAPDFAETVNKITNGGAKVGIEVTGVGAGLNGILDCMARFGRVALLGCTRNSNFTVDYYHKVHFRGVSLIGAHTMARPDNESHQGYWTQRADMEAVVKMTEYGRLKLSDLVDETHSYKEAPEIFTRLANDKVFPVVEFDWREENEKN